MKDQLFKTLDLNSLVDDFKQEVSSSPKDYFITPEMYQTLFEWQQQWSVSLRQSLYPSLVYFIDLYPWSLEILFMRFENW